MVFLGSRQWSGRGGAVQAAVRLNIGAVLGGYGAVLGLGVRRWWACKKKIELSPLKSDKAVPIISTRSG